MSNNNNIEISFFSDITKNGLNHIEIDKISIESNIGF